MKATHGTRLARRQLLTLLTATLVAVPFQRHDGLRAAPGDLDPTFGSGGRVVTAVSQWSDSLHAMALQDDGRIVVAGAAYPPGPPDLPTLALARYDTDGSLDATFGSGGVVLTDIEDGIDEAFGVAIRPDGRIVVVGGASPRGPVVDQYVVLLRYNADGTLDSTFGTGGIVKVDGVDTATDMELQPDGAILVASYGFYAPSFVDDFLVTRYTEEGALDTTFGDGGRVTTDFGGSESAIAIDLMDDGRIVAFGNKRSGFALARYLPDGTPDPTFGNGGKVTYETHNGTGTAHDVVVQPDGKVVGVGSAFVLSIDFYLLRFNVDGSFDTSFSGDGKAKVDFGGTYDEAKAAKIDAQGRILLAGTAPGSNGYDFAVARLLPDGELDTSFGNGGRMRAGFPHGADASTALLQPDGKFVVGGFAYPPGTAGDFGLVRFETQP